MQLHLYDYAYSAQAANSCDRSELWLYSDKNSHGLETVIGKEVTKPLTVPSHDPVISCAAAGRCGPKLLRQGPLPCPRCAGAVCSVGLLPRSTHPPSGAGSKHIHIYVTLQKTTPRVSHLKLSWGHLALAFLCQGDPTVLKSRFLRKKGTSVNHFMLVVVCRWSVLC